MGSVKAFFIEHWRKIIYIILCVLFVYFVINGKAEIFNLRTSIESARPLYLIMGVVATLIFITLQANIFKLNLEVVEGKVPLFICAVIYLKRFFISSFIPVGFSASQYTFTSRLENYNLRKPQIHLASTFYLLSGYISYLIISVPTIIYLMLKNQSKPSWGLVIVFLIWLVYFVYKELTLLLKKSGFLYGLIKKRFPKIYKNLDEIYESQINLTPFLKSIILAIICDIFGAVFILLSLLAIGQSLSIFHCIAAYVISILILTISPIFQGIILFELSMAYTLNMFGISEAAAFTAVLIFRMFQLWIPLLLGGVLVARKVAVKYLP